MSTEDGGRREVVCAWEEGKTPSEQKGLKGTRCQDRVSDAGSGALGRGRELKRQEMTLEGRSEAEPTR